MLIYSLLFYVFASLIVLSALFVVSAKNPVYSVLWLILSFFSTAGIFVMLGAEFVAMTLVIVYVGAVAVLFLFVIMMLNINFEIMKKQFYSYLPLLVLIALVLFADLYLALTLSEPIANSTEILVENPTPNPNEIANTHALGQIMYTKYFEAFQTAGLILLVAMIGAIVLTNRKRKAVRKQNIAEQIARDPNSSITLTNPKLGRGINGNL